jgi:hypothetical protein
MKTSPAELAALVVMHLSTGHRRFATSDQITKAQLGAPYSLDSSLH